MTKKTEILISPSILSANFAHLADDIREVEGAQCDMIHVDVMDGHFVPNLTIGPIVIKGIRKITKVPLDVHLMIENPLRYVEDYVNAGSDYITIHVEAEPKLRHTLKMIRKAGAKSGLSLRPKTPLKKILPFLDDVDLVLIMSVEPGFGGQAFMPGVVKKISDLRPKYSGLISIDGGINPETAVQAVEAGVDILVAGTAIFGAKDRADAIRALRSCR